MGFSHSINHSSRNLYTVAQGPITFAEIRTHLHQECADSALPYAELIDARSATVTPADVKSTVELLRRLAKQCPLGPTAIVVQTDFQYGMLRVLETLVEGICTIRPFRDRATAEQWLQSVRMGTREIPALEAPRSANQDPTSTQSANIAAFRGPLLTEVATPADSEIALEQRREIFTLQLIALLGILEVIAGILLWLKVSF